MQSNFFRSFHLFEGTSITNTIVSFMQAGNREEFSRAFSAATVHDIFNFLTVLVLLPIECLTNYLEFITGQIILTIDFKNQTTHKQSKPFIKQITAPFINSIIKVDNHLLEQIRLNNDTNASKDDDLSLMLRCCDKVPRKESKSNCIQNCKLWFSFEKRI